MGTPQVYQNDLVEFLDEEEKHIPVEYPDRKKIGDLKHLVRIGENSYEDPIYTDSRGW